ncbi:uncharacterized protein LOC126744028 isoform X2 [Anthonomus grandis grandis]|uniref:uncharacterized protein LOC126744028 isoform X2 n=1 Tax=Anthonomus grandis grandis TaxID=2921223 RepID=UPI0021663210|nr:uncharacterized protein LOC126744028 isoform X2 [Anthonomus grandis grandis]
MFLRLMVFLFIAATCFMVSDGQGSGGVKNFIGEPDYRQVRLHWEADSKAVPKTGFNVRYCELQSWGQQRCRLQPLSNITEEKNFIDGGDEIKQYSTYVRGLRMATTYSFEVKAIKEKEEKERQDRAEGDDRNQNLIVIPTKGFSAKATQCLPHASEIEVSTGPFFGGRIAVEAADGERCAIDGEPQSARDTYTLRINHTECGSQVNETTVATFVLVQENLPILTHSTRRFLVLCSYQPETLTVRAGISLPTGQQHRGQVQMQSAYDENEEDNSIGRRSRNLRLGRVMQKPEALVKEEIVHEIQPPYRSQIVPIFVITMLSIAGVIALVAIALKITGKRILREMDNISIASDLSVSSSSTISEIEMCIDEKPNKEVKDVV